jgi:hypothetical protein
VAAELVLDAGGLGHDREPLGRALGGQQGEHVQQRLAALVEPAGVGERERHRAQQAGALGALGVGSRRAQAAYQRAAVAGALPAAAAAASASTATAPWSPGRAHFSTWNARTAAAAPRGDALVRAQPPGRRRGVVDGAAQQRVAEAERAPVAGRADEVGRDEPVERGAGVGRVESRGGGRELGIERVAGDGGAVEQRARGGRHRADLELDRGEQRRRQRVAGVAGHAGELLQEERVAGGLARQALAQRDVRDVADQLERGGVGKGREGDEPAAGRGAGRVEDARRGLDRAQREDEQVRRARRAAQEVQDELDGGVVGPVQVVEQQRDRALAGEHLQQLAQRAGGCDSARRRRGRAAARRSGRRPRGARPRDLRRRTRSGAGAASRRGRRARRSRARTARRARAPPRARRARAGRRPARPWTAPSSALLPIPVSPRTASTRLSPSATSAIAASAAASSSSRPTSRAGAALIAARSAPVAFSASSASIVATSPSQPEKSVSVPSAAVTRPVRASSATCSSSARLIFRCSTDRSIHALAPAAIEDSPRPAPQCLA